MHFIFSVQHGDGCGDAREAAQQEDRLMGHMDARYIKHILYIIINIIEIEIEIEIDI